MALIAPQLAIVPVGISCQVAHQIEVHAPMLRKLTGFPLVEKGTPFDWVICGAQSAARMIERGAYFPTSRDEIDSDFKPYWPRFGVHFWHAKGGDFEDFVKKHQHLADNFATAGDAERKVFILANTQNNVGHMLADREGIERRLFWDDVTWVYRALESRFKRGVELHVVTREGLDDAARPSPFLFGIGGKPPRPPITIHRIGTDGSNWAGNSRAWQNLFRKIIP